MADEKKPVQDETAEKNKEAKAPVSEICGNAEEGAAALGILIAAIQHSFTLCAHSPQGLFGQRLFLRRQKTGDGRDVAAAAARPLVEDPAQRQAFVPVLRQSTQKLPFFHSFFASHFHRLRRILVL